MRSSIRAFWCLAGILPLACATAEEVGFSGDGGEVIPPLLDSGSSTGGAGTGTGGAGTGGIAAGGTGAGGVIGTGGGVTGGGSGDCGDGMKRCGGICVMPSFGVGCTLDNCDSCTNRPANAMGTCTNGMCDFICSPGFVRSADGTACDPENPGGTGGVTGAGGATGTGGFVVGTGGTTTGGCNPMLCSGIFACCTLTGDCGNGVAPFCF